MGRRDPETFLDPVRTFAETVLDRARDHPSTEAPELLADALDPATGDPARHDVRHVAVTEDALLSNFATQQEFLRTLVALADLTGEDAYDEAAVDLVERVFEQLTDPSGLLYWGGHAAYDLEEDAVRTAEDKGNVHELKADYPFYDLFWRVDPDATRRFVEAFWDAHIIDWSRLDFNRHGEYDRNRDPTWDRAYEGGDVFFWGDGLTFVNTGSDLYWAAASLADHDDSEAALSWAERLAERYVETRQDLGISGYQFSQHPSWCNGPEIRGDRAQYQFAPYLHGDHLVYEGTIFRPRPWAQHRQLLVGERLGDRGEQFTRWAVEELRAWREAAYRPERNDFEPMLTDGHSLEGFLVRREGYFGPQGRVIGPIEADASVLLVYATAYRATGEECCWRMVRDVARGLGLGDVGVPDGDPSLDATGADAGVDLLYALLELYRATETAAFRDAAWAVGETLLTERYRDGLFVDPDAGVARVGDALPLALLSLAAAAEGPDALADVPTRGERPGTPSGGV